MATEDIGGLYNTKQPGYDDAADIQAALKAFLYGSYDYDTTSTDPTQLPNPSLAHHLQGLKDRIQDQEDLGIGSDYLTLAQIAAIASPVDGYIAMASDSNGGAVESLYASAFYSNEAPTTDIVDGVLWVDKDSAALDTYVYDSTLLPGDPWVRINDLKNIIQAKGDILIGTGSEGLDNLTVGANGTVLTADDTQTLGVKWQAPVVYSQPTLGSTAIASGATVTNVNGLTINSTTIPTSKTLVATDSTAYVVPPMSGNSGKYLTNDGSTPSWGTVSGGGTTLITDVQLSASTGYDFSSIPNTYKNLVLTFAGLNISALSTNFGLRFNNNTSAVYENYTQYQESPASAPTSYSSLDTVVNDAIFGNQTTSGNPYQSARGTITIYDYASTTRTKLYVANFAHYSNNNGRTNFYTVVGNFNSTTPISSLNIVRFTGTSTISNSANTSIRLYGVS